METSDIYDVCGQSPPPPPSFMTLYGGNFNDNFMSQQKRTAGGVQMVLIFGLEGGVCRGVV